MKRAEELGAWMGDITSFGEFWRSRHNTPVAPALSGDELVIRLDAAQEDIHPGLAVVARNLSGVDRITLLDSRGRELSYEIRESPDGSARHITDIGQ
jgi:hypothetical protein